jgi:hypothetical protein
MCSVAGGLWSVGGWKSFGRLLGGSVATEKHVAIQIGDGVYQFIDIPVNILYCSSVSNVVLVFKGIMTKIVKQQMDQSR